jgi:Leucine-rich repeat (LRR) protein
LKTNCFKDFPTTDLNLSTDASGNSYGISSITGLSLFDLSSFTTIDLSGNEINSIGEELKKLDGLTEINLSNNNLTSFSYKSLSSACCVNSLEILNLENNYIQNCNLSGIVKASVNLSNNKITSTSITYPNIKACNVNLNFNYITEIDETQTNVMFGFQGAKDGDKFIKSTKISFYDFDDVKSVQVYENDELTETLVDSQETTLGVGNYSLKFLTEDQTIVSDLSLSLKVVLEQVTAKMFRDGSEIEYSSKIYNDTTIRFYGEENAQIFYKVGNGEFVEGDEVEITANGVTIISVYQVLNGYQSDVTQYYVNMNKSSLNSLILVVLCATAFVIFFAGAIWLSRNYTKIGDGKPTKGQLD